MAADPLVEHGISEFTAVDLVTCQSATAREGTEKLLSLIDEYGSSEVNIALIADQQETWYIEMYSGHHGCLTPQNAESQYWLIFLRKFKFCVMRIFVYSVIMDLCIYM